MTDAQFDALVQKLEPFARRDPRAYRLRVGLLAVLGYVYILLVLLVLLGLLGGIVYVLVTGHVSIVAVKLGIPVVILIGVIARSLWVSIPPPEEPELRREIAPRLFAALDALSDQLKAPRLHHVCLTDDFNAGILQVPKLGLLGWQTNYLLLGLPLMEALSPDQFRAVLAHELGHLSGNHSRFSGWVYRVRRTWLQLLVNLHEGGHSVVRLFTAFFRWYAPYFSAYSFVLARANEYVADKCAADATSPRTAADALVAVQVRGQFLEERFWPGVFRQTFHQPEPPAALYGSMFQALRTPSSPADAERWMDAALSERTGTGDTHPCLTDRLGALGFRAVSGGPLDAPKPPLPVPDAPAETAAQAFLGRMAETHAQMLDREWRQKVANQWQDEHGKRRLVPQDLQRLDREAAQGSLSLDDAWSRATLTSDLYGEEAALPLLREVADAHADHAPSNFLLGKALVERDDPRGLPYLERAMAREPDAIAPACEAAARFFRRTNRPADAARYSERAQAAAAKQTQARKERDELVKGDKFMPHGLAPEAVGLLRDAFSRQPNVDAAYLVRKQVTHFPDKPLYVLGLTLKSMQDGGASLRRVLNELEMPGETFVVDLNGQYKWLAPLLKTTPDALLSSRRS